MKTGENYAETIIAMSENVSTPNTAKDPNFQYHKSSIKNKRDKRGYLLLFSSSKGTVAGCNVANANQRQCCKSKLQAAAM